MERNRLSDKRTLMMGDLYNLACIPLDYKSACCSVLAVRHNQTHRSQHAIGYAPVVPQYSAHTPRLFRMRRKFEAIRHHLGDAGIFCDRHPRTSARRYRLFRSAGNNTFFFIIELVALRETKLRARQTGVVPEE